MRPIPTLFATSYQRSFYSGRTMPGVFVCEDAMGKPVGEYVVKLKGRVETANGGMLRELIGNVLANELGIHSPEPAIVEIPDRLSEGIIDPGVSQAVIQSIGLNFGSRNLAGGYFPWPDEKTLTPSLKQPALDIFVFDALIHNPDRRLGNPNLLWKSDDLVVIDHESAFSFLLAIPPIVEPWLLREQRYLDNHIFYRQLRGEDFDLARITGAIEAVAGEFWDELHVVVPNDWRGTEFARIRGHVDSVQEHLEEFMDDVRRVLQ